MVGWVGGDNSSGVEVAFQLNHLMSVSYFILKGAEDMVVVHLEGENP